MPWALHFHNWALQFLRRSVRSFECLGLKPALGHSNELAAAGVRDGADEGAGRVAASVHRPDEGARVAERGLAELERRRPARDAAAQDEPGVAAADLRPGLTQADIERERLAGAGPTCDRVDDPPRAGKVGFRS